MDLNTLTDAFDRVVKKQKLSYSRSQEVIDQVGREIQDASVKIQSLHGANIHVDQKSILLELKNRLIEIGPHNLLEGAQKELNINLSKYLKLLEKSYNPDISKAYRNVEFDFHTVNQIVVCHLYRQCLFDLGDVFIEEAGEPEPTLLKSQLMELYRILEAMRVKDLEPALNWISGNYEKLKQNGPTLALKLHALQFIEVLQKGSQDDIIRYARTYLSSFACTHFNEIQKLMACIVWKNRLESSPYPELLAPGRWEEFADELTRQFCSLIGQPYENPFSVTVAAGIEGLPTLLKLANVMAVKKQDWQTMKQLPVPIDLGKEFQFHSLFVCPVSRDQASEENPPMLLPCGHVLCKQSVMKLSKSSTRAFKCPYCPADASATQCRQLHI